MRFFAWIMEGRTALYPGDYLFLKSIEIALQVFSLDGKEFKGITRLPEDNPDMQGREALLFSFGDDKELVQVAISRTGKVLWQNLIEL